MGIYNQRRKLNNMSRKKTKTYGFVFCAVAIILALATLFIAPISKVVYSALGYFSYFVFFVMLVVGSAMSSGKKYYINKANVIACCLLLVSLSCVLQIVFSISTLNALPSISQLGEYLSFLISKPSFGGLVFGIVVFPFVSLLGVAGALVIFAILSLVFGGLMLDFLTSAKDRNSLKKMAQKRNRSFEDTKRGYDEMSVEFVADDTMNLGVIKNSYAGEESVFDAYGSEKDFAETELKNTEDETTASSNFDFFSNSANSVVEDVNDDEPILSSRDEARNKLFGNIINEVQDFEEEESAPQSKELSFEEKLERLRSEPAKPVFPDVFTNNSFGEEDSEKEERPASFERNRNVFDNFSDTFGSSNSENDGFDLSSTDRVSRRDRGVELDNSRDTLFGSTNREKPAVAEQTRLSGPFMPEKKSLFNKPTFSKRDSKYNSPPIALLKTISDDPSKYGGDYQKNSEILERTLSTFKINAKVVNVVRGPSVTRYEMAMPVGIPVKKVLAYESDLQAALCAKNGVRLEAPIPGKNAFGVELPNDPRSTVGFREIAESPEFNSSSAVLPIAIGKNITGEVVVKSLAKMVHMLVAGSTGSGKSIFLHNLIISLMYKESPERLKFIMIDPKRVEFPIYNGMPHLMIPNVITDPDKAVNAFSWAVKEMERRYKVLEQFRVRDLQEFNNLDVVKEGTEKVMPYIILVVDELAELMSVAKKEIEDKIRRISQLGRACGIHLVIATQRPSTEIVTGTIKANLPTRIAFTLGNRFDSETILGEPGAEKLLGQGDMLFLPQDSPIPTRLQGAYISTKEINEIIKYIKENNATAFDDDMEQFIAKTKDGSDAEVSGGGDHNKPREEDELFKDALKYVIERKKASTSMLQTRFYIGFNRATRLIAQMENNNYIGPQTGAKPREVYLSMEDYYNMYGTED